MDVEYTGRCKAMEGQRDAGKGFVQAGVERTWLTNGLGTDTWALEEITRGMEAVIYGGSDGRGLPTPTWSLYHTPSFPHLHFPFSPVFVSRCVCVCVSVSFLGIV